MVGMLTKTTYLAFVQCPKQAWLDEHTPLLKSAPDPASLRRMLNGQVVDKKARELFPNGRLIPYRIHPEEMVPLTTEAIVAGADTLFQATLAAADMLVKVDILQKIDDGWHLYEVKSSTSVKDEHLPDLAFQLFVCEQAGIPIAKASVIHLNRDCRYPDLADLFTTVDVTPQVRTWQAEVADDIVQMRMQLAQTQYPDVHIGRHCKRPYRCRFYEYCWQDIEGMTIYDIPRLNQQKEDQLQANGALYLQDVPESFPMTNTQRAFVDFYISEAIDIDRPAIQTALDSLRYPLYFFDFETIDHPIPQFEGSKPYQQIPFQYSCHRLDADGTLTHSEYLHTNADDPRRPLTEALLNDIGETGSIIVYFATFERGRLQELAEHLPAYAPRLQDMINRLWDQLDIFKKHYHDYRFAGSNSLKSVLPVLIPSLSYKLLAVQDGTQAQVVWEAMIREENTAVKEDLISQLLAYCHLDTLSMVEIHKKLAA